MLTDLLLRPVADAFLMVGVPVALLAALVAWARVRYGARALDVLMRHRRAAPVLGAAIGVVPGCGGAILVAVLHLRGRASFGTAVAALTATMGDASFVLLAVDPVVGVAVHGVLFVVGTLTGYAVDATGYAPRARARRRTVAASVGGGAPAAPAPAMPVAPAAVDPVADPHVAGPTVAGLAPGPLLLWLSALLGSFVAVPAMIAPDAPESLAAALGGLDVYLLTGLLGAVACGVVFFRSGCRMSDDTTEGPADLPAALTHGAVETAFITTWVTLAFVVLSVVEALVPFEASALGLAGMTAVLVGVAVAVVPGCGTQIAFTGLYAAGALPLPGLLANAIAQDGDALLPVLVADRRTAVALTLITSVPALLVGGLALLVL